MENVNLKLETLVQHRTSATRRLCDGDGLVATMNTITTTLLVLEIRVSYVAMIEITHRATIFKNKEYVNLKIETLVQHRTSATRRLCDGDGMVASMINITIFPFTRNTSFIYDWYRK
jgi:hypothetical protein